MSGLNNVSDIFISVNLENKNTLTAMTAFLFFIFCLLPSLLNLVCQWAMILVLSSCIFFLTYWYTTEVITQIGLMTFCHFTIHSVSFIDTSYYFFH